MSYRKTTKRLFAVVRCMVFLLIGALLLPSKTSAQSGMKFKFSVESLELAIGDSAKVIIKLVDENGNLVINEPFFMFAGGRRARRSVGVNPRRSDSSGSVVATVRAYKPGSFRLNVRKIPKGDERIFGMIAVDIPYPPLKEISFVTPRTKIYRGSTVRYEMKIYDKTGSEREDLQAILTSSNPKIASLDDYGNLTAHRKARYR